MVALLSMDNGERKGKQIKTPKKEKMASEMTEVKATKGRGVQYHSAICFPKVYARVVSSFGVRS